MIVSGITILQFLSIWQQPANDQHSCFCECAERPQLYSETLCSGRARNAPALNSSKHSAASAHTRTQGRVGHSTRGHQLEHQSQRDRREANSRNNFWHKRSTYQVEAAIIVEPVEERNILVHNGAEIPLAT
jgi:hypothetical protein